MAICTLCANFIRIVHPGPIPRKLSSSIYPPYDPSSAKKCWICSKLSEWLQLDEQIAIFDVWQRESLEIRFFLVEFKYAHNQLDPLVLHISICPPNVNLAYGCSIEVNVLNSEGTYSPCPRVFSLSIAT